VLWQDHSALNHWRKCLSSVCVNPSRSVFPTVVEMKKSALQQPLSIAADEVYLQWLSARTSCRFDPFNRGKSLFLLWEFD
jgi:hypothetical protein